MMKKIASFISGLTIIGLLVCCFVPSASAAYSRADYHVEQGIVSDNVYFYDESGLFSAEEKEQIETLLQKTANEIGFYLALYTAGVSRTDKQVENFADTGSRKIFGDSVKTGTVFLYVDLDGHSSPYDFMYAYREPFMYYSSELFGNRMDSILYKMQRYFPKSGEKIVTSDICQGLEEFCRQLIYYKNLGPEENCYYYHSDIHRYVYAENGVITQTILKPKVYWLPGVGLGLAAGFLTALITFTSVLRNYRFKKTKSASAYTSENSTRILYQEDHFLHKSVSSVDISSGSSHHSSHHSSHRGGGHSGGGGGGRHR